MSIVLVFNKNNPSPWKERLEKKLPNEVVEIHPNVKNKDAVRFALCWKPAPEVLQQYKNLEAVQSMGAGVDHILDTQTLGPAIKIARIVDTNLSNDMWEYLLTAILQHIKNFSSYQQYQQNQIWKPLGYTSIKETRVGILGLGEIGAYVASNLKKVGFIVMGWSSSVKNISGVESFVSKDGLKKMLSQTDIVINLLPSTQITKGILNKQLLHKTKKGCFLINVGRGDHLVEEDLLSVLDEGRFSGALLDVFHTEPLPAAHPFWKHPKIQITPHIASETNLDSATDLIAENYNRLISNQELLHVVSRSKGY